MNGRKVTLFMSFALREEFSELYVYCFSLFARSNGDSRLHSRRRALAPKAPRPPAGGCWCRDFRTPRKKKNPNRRNAPSRLLPFLLMVPAAGLKSKPRAPRPAYRVDFVAR